MPSFSEESFTELDSCHQDIRKILLVAIKIIDFKILQGYRGKEEQNKEFEKGNSKLKYPNSKHNKTPSLAVDIAPYPIDWNDLIRFAVLWGVIKTIAWALNIKLTWGGSWGWDWGHIELDTRKDNGK